jgi:hypothetical protein
MYLVIDLQLNIKTVSTDWSRQTWKDNLNIWLGELKTQARKYVSLDCPQVKRSTERWTGT